MANDRAPADRFGTTAAGISVTPATYRMCVRGSLCEMSFMAVCMVTPGAFASAVAKALLNPWKSRRLVRAVFL
ncbi:hypothetical protein [Sorangium sp. So ce1000]|uniref:hypothetical protein n=1 Tax=Sorangium sp. So ce1000 TaxID=3133325 RepID=UPI003F61C600